MIRVLACLLCLSLPAHATTDAYPALHDVVGVAADDVLNIRAEPSATSEIIGTLAHDAQGIEVIRPNDDFTWVQVNTGERSGWVSFSYLVPQPGQWYGLFPEIRQCYGTEPFWSLQMTGDGTVRYASQDGDAFEGIESERWTSDNRRDRYAFSARLANTGGLGDAEVLAKLSIEECSDFMSDRAYGIGIDLLIGNITGARMLSGCCSLAGN